MKKILFVLTASLFLVSAQAQIVAEFEGGYLSENTVANKIDIKEVGRSIHVATVEDGRVVVRRFYRGVWSEFDETPIRGINKLEALKLFAYKAVPYVFCQYDGKMSVIRAIADKWEFVGEEKFGDASVMNPEFDVIGEEPYIVYTDEDYDMLRMVSLLDNSWYDVDLLPSKGIKSYKLASNVMGDLYIAVLDGEGIMFREVEQLIENVSEWPELTKKVKLIGTERIDDFEFIENKAYLTYSTNLGPVIMSLEDLSKKWETVAKTEVSIVMGKTDYNLNISEYYFYTSLSAAGIPQYLKNNKKGVWGDVTDLTTKKATVVASCEYRNIIYVAYVESATSRIMIKTIEKGEEEEGTDTEKSK